MFSINQELESLHIGGVLFTWVVSNVTGCFYFLGTRFSNGSPGSISRLFKLLQ